MKCGFRSKSRHVSDIHVYSLLAANFVRAYDDFLVAGCVMLSNGVTLSLQPRSPHKCFVGTAPEASYMHYTPLATVYLYNNPFAIPPNDVPFTVDSVKQLDRACGSWSR